MKSKSVSWWVYLRNGIGIKLSKLGEKIGSDILIYNPMVMRQFHDQALLDAPIVIDAVVHAFPSINSILDVGSGSGAFSAEVVKRSKSAVALERSATGRQLAASQGVECYPFDLTISPPAGYSGRPNVVICFEVAEHLSKALGESLVRFIAGFHVPIVFSAAQPGQGGTGHINEQPREYWIEAFEQFDFKYSESMSNDFRKNCESGGASNWFCKNSIILLPVE